MELLLFDVSCLWKMVGSKMEVVGVAMVLWVVCNNLGVLLEVVILVQLMVWR